MTASPQSQPPLVPLASAAAIGGGLSLGFRLPFGLAAAQAAESLPADSVPEINAWVVIRPDDTVVIRIARSEMGQGTLTGLAQLVAEELECDWSKVTTEYPTPGENVARKRVWGDFSTGGSRGIRDSHEYVRQGRRRGARDADPRRGAWLGVPPAEVQRRQQRDHAHAVRPHDDLRQGRRGGRQARPAEGHQAEGPEGLEDRRQAGQAARHRRQGQRQAGLRDRPQAARAC